MAPRLITRATFSRTTHAAFVYIMIHKMLILSCCNAKYLISECYNVKIPNAVWSSCFVLRCHCTYCSNVKMPKVIVSSWLLSWCHFANIVILLILSFCLHYHNAYIVILLIFIVILLTAIMSLLVGLNVLLQCCNAQWHYAECCYRECHYAGRH